MNAVRSLGGGLSYDCGRAFSALGKKEEALSVWEKGYEHSFSQSADLKQLLELEDLVRIAKKTSTSTSSNHEMESAGSSFHASKSITSVEANEASDGQMKLNGKVEPFRNSSDQWEVNNRVKNQSGLNANGTGVLDSQSSQNQESNDSETNGLCDKTNGMFNKSNGIFEKFAGQSGLSGSSESCIDSSAIGSDSVDLSDICSSSINLSDIHRESIDEDTKNKKFCVARISKNKSINVDFRLSRGIAQVNDGNYGHAISIFDKILLEDPDYPEALIGRGTAYAFQRELHTAIADFTKGLSLSSLGEYKRAEEAHRKAIQIDQNFLEAWTHLTQFYQDMADSEKALQCLHDVLQIDGRFAKAYHLRGLLLHGIGEHRNAIKELSVGLSIESSNIECLYLRASCYHAIGELKEAVKDYDAALDLELDSMEKFVLQCSAFYQKEIALYTASKYNTEFSWFNLDGDIDPLFKEYWCKRLHPKNVCEKVYRQPPLRDSLRKGKLKKQEFVLTKQKATLLQYADSIGKKIQYHCRGFLPNRRQYRMAGLAAIEIAQKVSKVWRLLQNEWKQLNKGTSKPGKKIRRKEKPNSSQNRGGAGCSTSGFSEATMSYSTIDDRSVGHPSMSWHNIYSLAVKWRQISEPCDPVVWVNKLRALNVAKEVINNNKYVRDKKDRIINLNEDERLQEILKAESCSDLYRTVGGDFWLATCCKSTAVEGKDLEGTRITLVKSGNHGFDFAIKTPCTPARWDDFDVEMTSSWEAVCDAYCGESFGATDIDALENVREAILRMTYYWYNFMPLCRGSSVVGFVVLLGLFLAANMEFTGSIPAGVQVDWEAILESDPSNFVSSVKSWMYPCLKVNTSWKGCPDVTSTFETTGSVLAALSTYSY
ncbi:tetratricopeptide repeat protein 13-like [Dorcoceras hygrometricum]|uniref:Tetratricopeptide repeat protein 13-like n=1 Tax=Dorcoceras hygrometricum TaxID=472368 RepID=A0A2Z7AUC2_9LAMI|nr:tetratricopeptide repeat protein 13-like [Dorcoceras hygrometricum]